MGNKILFITPTFFDYWKLIKKGLEDEGYEVDVISSPKSFIYKLLEFKFANSNFFHNYRHHIYQKYLNKLSFNYNIILVIEASLLPADFLVNLRKRLPNARYIQYLWDDISIDSKSVDTFKYFDKVLSFNKYDCDKYHLIWRPFFYNYVRPITTTREIDLFYVASYKNERFTLVKGLISYANKNNLKFRFILKSSVFLFLSKIEHLKYISIFSRRGITYEEMMEYLSMSKCSIEMPHRGQIGLTTRPFESLATRTKVITTNKDIVNYDFYHPDNILVVDSENIEIPTDWLFKPYVELPDCVIKNYSLEQFIVDILK